jgi:hypothetical protein
MIDIAARLYLIGAGLAVAVHFHCMANFLTQAPHLVKALLVPAATAAGVGMAMSGAFGSISYGMMFGAAAAGAMAGIHIAAWSAGAYVSEQFARAARMRQNTTRFMREMCDPARDLSDILTDSGIREVKAKQHEGA